MMRNVTNPASWRARLNKRAYWSVLYRDGTIINEWDGIDWSVLKRDGLMSARLYCPNGQIAELGNTIEAGRRLFQFKGGMLMGGLRSTEYQLIGLVNDPSTGECTCAVWHYRSGKLSTFKDNVFQMQFENVGRVALENVGVRL